MRPETSTTYRWTRSRRKRSSQRGRSTCTSERREALFLHLVSEEMAAWVRKRPCSSKARSNSRRGRALVSRPGCTRSFVCLAQVTPTTPMLTNALAQDDEIAVFRLNFRAELESALATLFAEAQGRLGRPSPKSGSVEAFPQCTFHLHWRPATPQRSCRSDRIRRARILFAGFNAARGTGRCDVIPICSKQTHVAFCCQRHASRFD